jgi:hypothetical protein
MYSNYLKINYCENKYKSPETNEKSNSSCLMCGGTYKKMYKTSIDELKIMVDSCGLCHCVNTYQDMYYGKCFLVHSMLLQSDINNKILTHYNKTNTILKPTEIDEDVLLVKIQIDEFINKNINFENIKIMFSNDIIPLLKKECSNYFSTISQLKIYDNSYFNMNTYKLTKSQLKILNKNTDNDKLYEINEIKKSLNNKILKAKQKDLFISNINN